jgi:hypothetical protein
MCCTNVWPHSALVTTAAYLLSSSTLVTPNPSVSLVQFRVVCYIRYRPGTAIGCGTSVRPAQKCTLLIIWTALCLPLPDALNRGPTRVLVSTSVIQTFTVLPPAAANRQQQQPVAEPMSNGTHFLNK